MTNMNTFALMTDSTIKYVTRKIDGSSNRLYYASSMLEIKLAASNAGTLEQLQEALHRDYLYLNKTLRGGFIINERKYTLLAYEHAFDIIKSINTRFVQGGTGTTYYVD